MGVGLYQSQMVIALEELNFLWNIREVKRVEKWWEDGMSIWDMGRELGRDPDEVAILIMDLMRNGIIKYRKGGALGNG